MKAQGVRLEWSDMPASVRAEIERVVGATVVEARTQPGGFSPGLAARCVLDDGRRCFIKAVSTEQNPESPHMHRNEAKVAAALPVDVGAPRLWHVVDDGRWVTLVFDDVDGAPPAQPWTFDELGRVFAALDRLADGATPSPVRDLPTFAQRHRVAFSGFRSLAADAATHPALDDWTARQLDRLAALEENWEAASSGNTLVHSDVRADNLLITTDGRVVLVDWPHASIGASWLDKVLLIPSVGLNGGPSPRDIEDRLTPFNGIDPELIDHVVVALAGYFTSHSLQPAPVGLPTLRAFQAQQGAVARRWLQLRLRL
jgi:aminoglycoside phosphotransferase (APT) family kinase protein